MEKQKTVYISGGITNVPDYMGRFEAAEEYLSGKGYRVINPAKTAAALPALEYEEYMLIAFSELHISDAVYFLKGWRQSHGSGREYGYAAALGKEMMFEE